MDHNAFILKVLQITSEADSCETIWWRTDDEYAPCTFFINCNDLFFWGCADCETLTYENVDRLKKAYDDAGLLGFNTYGDLLFCCRERKMRPQYPYYKHIPKKLWPLFDECGPERTDTGKRQD